MKSFVIRLKKAVKLCCEVNLACIIGKLGCNMYMRVYPKVSGLTTLSKNCKWYSSVQLGAVLLLFCESA
jgi:hypothetical protein